MQALATTKNYATSWDKKKITQPLGTKNSHKLLGKKNQATFWFEKNHATSRDNNKNHKNSWDKKKVMKHLGPKKTNHATSHDKKNHPTGFLDSLLSATLTSS